jgi:hypothetical protein
LYCCARVDSQSPNARLINNTAHAKIRTAKPAGDGFIFEPLCI